MARTKIGRGYSRKNLAPRKQLATKSARKSAPSLRHWADSESDTEHSESVSEKEDSNDSGSPTSGSNFRSYSEKSTQRREALFNDLSNALCGPSHKRYGTFASCEGVKYSREGLILKFLSVEGAGELQLPFSNEDVSKLRGASEKAPFGQCLEVDASKVTFSGAPNFMSKTIQLLAMHAVRGLGRHGAAGELQVKLDKLLLCETDDHFTFCRHRRKENGLFATLLLQIPTEDGYEGGSLVVQHEKLRKTFDCHLVSSVGFCYTVFYADCEQQLQKIECGARVCLTFDIVRSDSSVEALRQEFIDSKWRETDAALQPWLTEVLTGNWKTYSPKLAIPLTQKYSEGTLAFDALKGHDSVILEELKKCAQKDGKQLLDLHLCRVTDYRYGDVDLSAGACTRQHCDSDQDCYSDSDASLHLDDVDSKIKCGSKIKLEFWVGEENKLAMAFGKLGLDIRETVVGKGQRPFFAKPDREKYKQYKRDSGPMWEEWYHRVMLIVWPKKLSISLFCEAKVSYALDLLECTFAITDLNFCEHLLRILSWCENNVLRVWEMGCHSNDSVTPRLLQLCSSASELKDVLQGVFKMLVKTHSYTDDSTYKPNEVSFQIGIRNTKVAKAIVGVVEVQGWTMSSSLILELVKECALLQGDTFARLAKELFLVGQTDAGTFVANSITELFEARLTEVEQHREPGLFSWTEEWRRIKSRLKRAKAGGLKTAPNAVGGHDAKRQRRNSAEDVVYLSSDDGED